MAPPNNQSDINKLTAQLATLSAQQASIVSSVLILNGVVSSIVERVAVLETEPEPPPVVPPPVVPPIPPVVPPVVPTDPPDTGLVPAESRTTWAPGVTTSIPARQSVFRVITASEASNGALESSTLIQAEIDACPLGHVIELRPGTFLCNNHILLNKAITLRGAGAGKTFLVKTNGAKPNSYQSEEQDAIVVIGPQRFPQFDVTRSVAVSGAAGSMSAIVDDATGLAPGQFVFLDRNDYAVGDWRALPPRNGAPTAVKIWASDTVVFAKHNPPENGDDPFPASLTWFSRSGRPVNEIKEIASVDGNRITFTTPLHADYLAVYHSAQLTRWTTPHVKGAGLEDLTVSGGSDGNIRMEAAAYCWVKNVENTAWLGEAVSMNGAFRCEVRDSYIHDCVHPYPGGGGYGLALNWGSSEILLENNIVLGMNKVMAVKSAGAGSVVGYNYMDNAFIGNYLDWVEVGINGSHMVGGHHILFEGNQSCNYDSDDTHGSAFGMTIFRNHLIGRRRDYPNSQNARCAGLMFGSWWHSFIGNVLGEDGKMAGWMYDTWNPLNGVGSIWKFGYAPSMWSQAADPKVLSTVLRDGNFDYLTNAVKWDRAPQVLPDSLYLTSKPAFFGEMAWPWVDPTGAVKVKILPARARYEAMAK